MNTITSGEGRIYVLVNVSQGRWAYTHILPSRETAHTQTYGGGGGMVVHPAWGAQET